MKIRTRIFLGYFMITALVFYFIVNWIRDDIRQNYLESMEDTLVDTSNVLSVLVADNVENGKINPKRFRDAFNKVYKRELKAKIYELTKSKVDLKVYITDINGIILFDSGNPENEGKDYSRWRDVKRTLEGKYGARATRRIKTDPTSQLMHVASPIIVDGKLAGVLSVYKPIDLISQFIKVAKQKILTHAVLAGLLILFLSLFISAWLSDPIHKLTEYAKSISGGKKVKAPMLQGQGEISVLGAAFEEMREALEGKKYIEQYVQNLTHELKSPLSAIKGASELLEDDLDIEMRKKFLSNIRKETDRMQQIVDRMLKLSILENRNVLDDTETVNLNEMISNNVSSYSSLNRGRKVIFEDNEDTIEIEAESFLLYEAIDNLLRNAVDFIPEKGSVTIKTEKTDSSIIITITDNGPGIPAYAMDRVFEKFYSLPRPESGVKSSGLGLSITREIIELHKGSVTIENAPEGGVKATITIPLP